MAECKKENCTNAPDGMNGYCDGCTRTGLDGLLGRLRAEPMAKEREEFGKLLMIHIDDFTPEQRTRYDELKKLLSKN